MEEKVLLPEARRLRGGEPLPVAKQLRADHAALASLLVPTPTHEIVTAIRGVLEQHNPLEEGADGLYAACERLAGPEVEKLLARLQAVPEVPVAAHFDGPRVHEHIARLLRARATPFSSYAGDTVKVSVECYAGYRGEETPRALIIGERRVRVADVIDRWLAPDHRYFKIRGDDGAVYILRHEVDAGDWELTVYEH